MRHPGEILLVSCYEQGHQPFHLASLTAMLTQDGYQPTCVDTAVDALSEQQIRQARFVGIAVPMHTALRLGEQIIAQVRAIQPEAHICLYGLYALLNAEYLLEQGLIDSAIGGEYETPLCQLVRALETEVEPQVSGVYTRHHPSGPFIQRTAFVVPQRATLPSLTNYARLQWGSSLRVVGATETTRGCKHTCMHCPLTPIYHGRFFAISQEVVLADIRQQVAAGARHITFNDPDFWNGPTHALRILRAMHREFPELTFDATIKIEHLLQHHELLPEMKTLGCAFIVSAVESLNDDILAHLDKGHSATDVAIAFSIMDEVGITLRPSLLPFTPWETLDSYIELLNFFEHHHYIEHLDPVHLSIRLLVPPGSAHLSDPASMEWFQDFDPAAFSYRWQHPDPRMDELQGRIADLVEQAEGCQAETIQTFFAVKALALSYTGQRFSALRAQRQYGAQKILPHLTESWFC